jgi:hypothetical protein
MINNHIFLNKRKNKNMHNINDMIKRICIIHTPGYIKLKKYNLI